MKSKLKKIVIPFMGMIAINLLLSPDIFWELGIEAPNVGLLFVFGLLFGPYGALGATLANIILDLLNQYTPLEILPSAIVSFAVSYLAYKLWYSGFKTDKITRPQLNNIYHLTLFLSSILLCGLVYSTFHGNLFGILITNVEDEFYFVSYFFNFINIAFIFGILGIWLFKKSNLIETPKTSKRPVNKKFYRIVFYSLIIVTIVSSASPILNIDSNIVIGELILLVILLLIYLTKPFEYKIQSSDKNTIIEKIIRIFLIITLTIAIIGFIISVLSYGYVTHMNDINIYLYSLPSLIITDVILILFFIPGIIILKYIEDNVIKPMSSFSKIEDFINENEKIESEGLVEIYSKYINEKNEIGTLARSYTELINHNNRYIENIHEIEGEKERIKAELNIATKIQASNLPTEAIECDNYIVYGYSKPAKEVGGDFFDYYMLDDENLAIAIGDASGKGVPAALLATITQVMLKPLLNNDLDPSNALFQLNNQLCEKNSETMFITLWLGVYNKTTGKLTFSNAGHNPPLIREEGKFKYLNIDSGIVLGIIEDFEFVKEEITLFDEIITYTDGITDANNKENKMYGEYRFLNFLNGFESDENPIEPLLKDIRKFTEDAEQYDDMTLVYLKIKDD